MVAAARGMVGTRWHHQGRKPGVALDCAGLVVCVGKQLGLLTFDTVAYQRDSAANHFVRYFQQHGIERPRRSLAPGCVVALHEARYPCHCGIVARQGKRLTLIHAYARRRAVVEELLTLEWYVRIVGVFDYVGLDDG